MTGVPDLIVLVQPKSLASFWGMTAVRQRSGRQRRNAIRIGILDQTSKTKILNQTSSQTTSSASPDMANRVFGHVLLMPAIKAVGECEVLLKSGCAAQAPRSKLRVSGVTRVTLERPAEGLATDARASQHSRPHPQISADFARTGREYHHTTRNSLAAVTAVRHSNGKLWKIDPL